MVRLTAEHAPTLRALRAAADRRATADAELERLAVNAVRAGVPALHVADAAGIGRATLYRWLGQEVES
jgi:hypothetical protein